jgi:diguanylate cyclase (GGDEF)-like protein
MSISPEASGRCRIGIGLLHRSKRRSAVAMDTDVNGATRHHQTRRAVDVESGEQAAGTNGRKAPVSGDAQAAGLELRSRFYQSVAETLTLLHTAPGYDRRLAVVGIARILAATMNLPLVWIGRRSPDEATVQVLAAAGPESDYAATLQLSNRADEPGGSGPVGIALREHRAQAAAIDEPVFAPWRAAAARHGFSSCIVAAAGTRDGGQLALAVYAGAGADLSEDLLDWAQRLADELARFWDHQALVERSARMSRYRDAQRTIQRALLEQPDPEAVYRTLAQSLGEIAGAAAVDVLVTEADGTSLRRVALAGPIAEELGRLIPTTPVEGARVPLPLRALREGRPQIRIRPSERSDMSPIWRHGLLSGMGASGCWPIPAPDHASGRAATPVGVFALITPEEDAFAEEMCRVLDELAEVAGLALRQHERRRAQIEEQQRQTYLALHDALTGLPNRRALDEFCRKAQTQAMEKGTPLSVLLLDIDHFKNVNDSMGHEVGDLVLRQVSHLLLKGVREVDYVARWGGEEFLIVLPDTSLDAAWMVAERLRQGLAGQPLSAGERTLDASMTLGVATLGPDEVSEQAIARADMALYEGKRGGRNQVVTAKQ